MSKIQTATLIFNPRAGTANFKARLGDLQQFWRRHGWEVDIAPTQRPRHATELARAAAARGERLVLAAGGDGTLGEVATGVAHSETIMAPLPLGTANAFAQELRLPRPSRLRPDRLLEAAATLAAGRVYELDVGRNESGRYWLLWTGVGLDSHIVAGIEPRSPLVKKLGRLSYIARALTLTPSWQGMAAQITVDEETVTDTFFMVTATNCRLYAGGYLTLSQSAQMDDGIFDVWLFQGRRKQDAFRYLLAIARQQHRDHPGIRHLQGKRRFRVEATDQTPWPIHVDGDPAGVTPMEWTFHQRALRLLVPNTAPDDLFQAPGHPLAEVI